MDKQHSWKKWIEHLVKGGARLSPRRKGRPNSEGVASKMGGGNTEKGKYPGRGGARLSKRFLEDKTWSCGRQPISTSESIPKKETALPIFNLKLVARQGHEEGKGSGAMQSASILLRLIGTRALPYPG